MIVDAPTHAILLAALHAASFPPAERWDAPAMAALLDMPGCFACLDQEAGNPPTPVGMALARTVADEAELLTIAVLPPRRGRGIGRMLLDEACSEASRRGAARMFLEVAVANAAACALYRAAGFRQVGHRPAYYADGADALLLGLVLASKARGFAP